MFYREIEPSPRRSFFLFGARGSGKSTYIKSHFLPKNKNQSSLTIDLLDSRQEDDFRSQPSRLEALPESLNWVFLDEIQKVPALLDHVHRLIEKRKHLFILSGSSARKIKRGGANLLAGRAFVEYMFPLTYTELGKDFHLSEILHWGSLPGRWELKTDTERTDFLSAYVFTYVKEEIMVEQLVRKVDPFRDFLEVAGQCNGKILSYSKMARELGVDYKTVEVYFQILEDTHLAFRLPGFHLSVRKSQTLHPKFYLFDLGVKRAMERSHKDRFSENSYAFGNAFEHLVIVEIFRKNVYRKENYRLSYLRTKDGAEVDLILSRGKTIHLIEIKSYRRVDPGDAKKLAVFKKDISGSHAWLLSRDEGELNWEGVRCLPWQKGITEIFSSPGKR